MATELALFESAMRVCPSSLKVRSNLALMYLQRAGDGDAARAEGLLDGALALHANFSAALFNRGLSRMLQRRTLDAIDDFEGSLVVQPHQPKARAYLGNELMRLSQRLQGDARLAFDGPRATGALTLSQLPPAALGTAAGQADDGGHASTSARGSAEAIDALLDAATEHLDMSIAQGIALARRPAPRRRMCLCLRLSSPF